MPSARVTTLMAALVLLGTGYLFFFEGQSESTAQHRQGEGRVLRLSADEVRRIKIRRDAWTSAVLERVDAHGFRLVEPTEGPADAAAVQKLLSELEFLKSHGRLAGADEAGRVSYGLRPARLEVDLEVGEGREVRVSLGSAPPVGGGVYLAVEGEADVHVVSKHVLEAASELLDRSVGAPPPEAAQKEEAR
ncbi:MAG TPA: DUF4340 domain-containing protein [Myxococcales bacterium]|jgi:hypothetical protein